MKRLLLALPFLAGCFSFHAGAMPGEPSKATFAQVAGARVRYLDVGKGNGPPVVLIHGFASSLETWELLVPQLSKTHRVVALDLKGFGWTDRPEGDYSPAAQAKLVLQLMDHLGIDKAAFVGHSWGSSVTLALALGAPERVTRVALYDAWVYEEQLPATFLMARASAVGEILFTLFYDQRPDERLALAFYDKDLLTEKLAEDVEKSLDRPGTGAAQLAAVRGQRFTEQQEKYRTIDKPVLLLWGREDVVTTLPFGERLARDLPHARLVVYPRCGHFPMFEAKNESNNEVIKFLAEDSGRDGGDPHTPGPAGAAPAAPRASASGPAKDAKPAEEKK